MVYNIFFTKETEEEAPRDTGSVLINFQYNTNVFSRKILVLIWVSVMLLHAIYAFITKSMNAKWSLVNEDQSAKVPTFCPILFGFYTSWFIRFFLNKRMYQILIDIYNSHITRWWQKYCFRYKCHIFGFCFLYPLILSRNST